MWRVGHDRRRRGIWNQLGVTTTEYLVILSVGVLMLLGAIQVFGSGLSEQYDSASHFAFGSSDTGGSTGRSGGQSEVRGAVGDGAEEEEDGNEAVFTGDVERETRRIEAGPRPEESPGSVGGVNPLIILMVIAGGLFVGYMMFSNDED